MVSFIGCDSCSDYASCDIKDHCRWKACAERLESQENEIADLKKQIAETYTAEQYQKDARRMIDKDYPAWLVRHMTDNPQDESNYVREWAASHPEKPKVTNGDKMRELFEENFGVCDMCSCDCPNRDPEGYDDSCPVSIVGWEQMEYKAPSDK